MPATIGVLGQHPALRFAASELARLLRLATGGRLAILPASRAAGATFLLGLCEDVGDRRPAGVTPDDDWVRVRPGDAAGQYVFTGSNPRSVLFGVYRYLHAGGFRWLRPGARGQVVPRLRSPVIRGVDINERPAHKYRTICIEGASSVDHICDLIDWQAKQSMNGYFVQFHHGTTFFRRWYQHRGSTVLKPEAADDASVASFSARIEKEIARRGLNFERMGHGWTCAALGISGEDGWDKKEDEPIPADKRDWLAQVNGRRELWGGVALNTNLNYGNPDVRGAMTDAIVAYAGQHPEVNLLHFWLADGSNNHDERPESAAARPSDFYVDMLNELDEKLSAAGLSTRIVFLVYVDLLWPPERSRIRNPDRFVLMFAPITRSYLSSFKDALARPGAEGMTPFVRNKLQMPKSAAANIAYLRAWREQFKGDAFDFDYHAIWPCYYEPGMFTISHTLYRDIQGLAAIGLNGINSCQVQRQSFPTNLLMDVMARALWNPRRSFASLVTESFSDAFGPKDGPTVARFLSQVAQHWDPFFEATYIPAADEKRIARGLKNLPIIAALIEKIRPLVERRVAAAGKLPPAVAWSWKYLRVHLGLLDLLLPTFEAYLRRDPGMRDRLNRAIDYIWKQEKRIHPALDCYMLVVVLKWRANELEAFLKESPVGQTAPA